MEDLSNYPRRTLLDAVFVIVSSEPTIRVDLIGLSKDRAAAVLIRLGLGKAIIMLPMYGSEGTGHKLPVLKLGGW